MSVRTELVDEGEAIVRDGRAQEVLLGLDQGPQFALLGYWKFRRQQLAETGSCGNCGRCEMVRLRNGSELCPETGETCIGTLAKIFGRRNR